MISSTAKASETAGLISFRLIFCFDSWFFFFSFYVFIFHIWILWSSAILNCNLGDWMSDRPRGPRFVCQRSRARARIQITSSFERIWIRSITTNAYLVGWNWCSFCVWLQWQRREFLINQSYELSLCMQTISEQFGCTRYGTHPRALCSRGCNI